MATRFRDRTHAGRLLAGLLTPYASRDDVAVIGLPRGGVPVAAEVARALRAPLDVLVVRKLGVPGHEELAVGAIAAGGISYIDRALAARLGVSDANIDTVASKERAELDRRDSLYREHGQPLELRGRVVIVVDDGLATGSTMQAAVVALRDAAPREIVVATPVAPPEVCLRLRTLVDDVVCAVTPGDLRSVGSWYDDFSQTTDDEVRALLQDARGAVHERR